MFQQQITTRIPFFSAVKGATPPEEDDTGCYKQKEKKSPTLPVIQIFSRIGLLKWTDYILFCTLYVYVQDTSLTAPRGKRKTPSRGTHYCREGRRRKSCLFSFPFLLLTSSKERRKLRRRNHFSDSKIISRGGRGAASWGSLFSLLFAPPLSSILQTG